MKQKKQLKRKKRPLPSIVFGMLLIIICFVMAILALGNRETKNNGLGNGTPIELTHDEFIERLLPKAKELQEGYGILPSIIIGQAILESNFGASELSSKYNNLFGMKAFGDQPKVKMDTQEFVNEQWITIKGDFRVYDSWEESMVSHTMLFVNGVDWSREKYEHVLSAANYKEAAQALQDAGYATDPTYAEKIQHVIETYELYHYDS